MKTKKCNGCGKNKGLSHFNRRPDSRDGYRGKCKPCDKPKGIPSPGNEPAGGGRLPVGPFRRWLEGRLEYYDGSKKVLADATGLDERQIYRLLNEGDKVALDTVDRALTNERSTFLWQLGYSEEEFAIAAKEARKSELRRARQAKVRR